MSELHSFLTAWLADVLVLGTALLALASLFFVMLRQPAARMAMARGTLLGLATLCVVTALPYWPRQPLAEVFSARAAEENRDEAQSVLEEAGATTPAPLMFEALPLMAENPLAAATSAPSLTFTKITKLLPWSWLGAAVCVLAYIFIGAGRSFRLLRTAVKAPDWSQQELERLVPPKNRSPRLKTSERIATAVAMLAWRPHILLATRSVREENRAAVRAALAHEWAHIRHGDLWLLALERLLLPVFCLHPLFWLLRRQIRIDQELLADAAAAGDAPVEYAESLLSWAKAESSAAAPHWGIAALPLWDHPSNLSRRVEMLLHAPTFVSARGSRLWKWLAPLSLLVMVLGLSLFTLRPAAIAQDAAATDIEAQPRPEKIKKAKKEKPKKAETKHDEVRPDKSLPRSPASKTQVYLQLMVGRVEHAALEKAESSLGDLIQAAAEDHCRLEGNLIVAELSGEKFAALTDELKQVNALDILSLPRLVTLDGQEARLQVGTQVPLMLSDPAAKGDPDRRVKFQEVGETIVICPHVSHKDPTRLTLDITATHTEFDKRAERTTGDEIPKFIKHEFSLEIEATVGKTLVITEREPKKGSGRSHSLLLSIMTQKIALPVPAPAAQAKVQSRTSIDVARLQDENALLRQKIQDLQGKLIDLEVQIRWLRAAAVPGGEDKVNDEMFLRRVYLDLTGAVPTPEETRAFLRDKDKQKRDKLIDKLLEGKVFRSPDEAEKWKDALKSQTEPDASSTKPASQPTDGEAEIVQIVRLTRISADDAARKLTALFELASEKPSIVAEERTNALLLRGSPQTLKTAIDLLEVLDVEPAPASKSKNEKPQANENSVKELKELEMLKAESTILQSVRANYERMRVLRKEGGASETELARALQQLKHAELTLEATKSNKPTPRLFELEVQEAEAEVAAKRAQLEESGKDNPSRALVERDLQLSRQHLEAKRARLEEIWAREKH